MKIPIKYSEMARSMISLNESQLTKILFLLDEYLKIVPFPTLEGFYKTIDTVTKYKGGLDERKDKDDRN